MQQRQQTTVKDEPTDFDCFKNTSLSTACDNSSSTFSKEEDVDECGKNSSGVTKTIQKIPFKKKKYHNITDSMRLKLIEAVEQKGERIKHAAKRLRINYSSAKSICQVFKKEGRANKKAFKVRAPKHQNHSSNKDFTVKDSGFNLIKSESMLLDQREIEPISTYLEPIGPQKESLKLLRDQLLGLKESSTNQPPLEKSKSLEVKQDNHHNVLSPPPIVKPHINETDYFAKVAFLGNQQGNGHNGSFMSTSTKEPPKLNPLAYSTIPMVMKREPKLFVMENVHNQFSGNPQVNYNVFPQQNMLLRNEQYLTKVEPYKQAFPMNQQMPYVNPSLLQSYELPHYSPITSFLPQTNPMQNLPIQAMTSQAMMPSIIDSNLMKLQYLGPKMVNEPGLPFVKSEPMMYGDFTYGWQ